MKKIRLANGLEMEVYHIAEADNVLSIEMLNADTTELQEIFSVPTNLTTIQYIVGTEILKGYAGFTTLLGIDSAANQLISIDYSTPDPDTPSGFKEDRETIVTVSLKKPTTIEEIGKQTAENTADIEYLFMMLEPTE